MKENIKYFINSKYYMFFLGWISLLCYGFAATNISVGIDDLEGGIYVGEGQAMMSSGRFGMVFLSKLFGYGNAEPFKSYAIDVIAITAFIASAIVFCSLLRDVSNDNISMFGYSIFSGLLLSYPLIHEIWEYTGANLCVCVGYLSVAISVYSIWNLIHKDNHKTVQREKKSFEWIIPIFLLTIVCSTYESLAVVYVFSVFLVLGMNVLYGKNECEKDTKGVLGLGCKFAFFLGCGLFCRILIHKIILIVFQLSPKTVGATTIRWGKESMIVIIKDLLVKGINRYCVMGLFYFPVAECVIAILVFIILMIVVIFRKKNYRFSLMIVGIGLVFSLFLLSIIQGQVTNYRTCQVWGMFVAVVGMGLVQFVETRKWKVKSIIQYCIYCGLSILCIQQSVYLSSMLSLNHVKSEEEAAIVRNIGQELEENFNNKKPIIFTGNHMLSDNIMKYTTVDKDSFSWKIYRNILYLQSDGYNDRVKEIDSKPMEYMLDAVSSRINWSIDSFAGSAMERLFSYYGYDIKIENDKEKRDKANDYVKKTNMPAYPQKGYYEEKQEYIIVNLE